MGENVVGMRVWASHKWKHVKRGGLGLLRNEAMGHHCLEMCLGEAEGGFSQRTGFSMACVVRPEMQWVPHHGKTERKPKGTTFRVAKRHCLSGWELGLPEASYQQGLMPLFTQNGLVSSKLLGCCRGSEPATTPTTGESGSGEITLCCR